MRMSMAITAVAGASLALASSAQANFIDVDLAGWVAEGGYTNPGNTNLTINLPVGAQVLSAEYIDLEFESFGISWNSELRLSLNDSVDFIGGFWDVGIIGTGDTSGPFGPVSETFANSPGIGGPPIDLTTGELYIEIYATFTGGVDDFHVISAGTLRIEWVPAPGAAGLLALGGLAAVRRRR